MLSPVLANKRTTRNSMRWEGCVATLPNLLVATTLTRPLALTSNRSSTSIRSQLASYLEMGAISTRRKRRRGQKMRQKTPMEMLFSLPSRNQMASTQVDDAFSCQPRVETSAHGPARDHPMVLDPKSRLSRSDHLMLDDYLPRSRSALLSRARSLLLTDLR